MDMQLAIRRVMHRQNLTLPEMMEVMRIIMTGAATPAQIGGFLVGLRMKGEATEEIVAAATVMRELAEKVNVDTRHLVDTCGTGGDTSGTFNISTASAFVVAAAGGKVAKHGNRSVSSKSGSADVLEAAGAKLDLTPDQVARCVNEIGVGFMFAPLHHSAMKHAIGPRREMGVRTLFNLLGPLTNPASAPNQVIGVFSEEWLQPFAEVLAQLGSRHVLVVNAEDGLDEISIGCATRVVELKEGNLQRYTITPEQFGIQRHDLAAIKVSNAAESWSLIKAALSNRPHPAGDIIALNAGAALYAAGVAADFKQGVDRARQAIVDGAAQRKMQQFIAYTNSF